MVRFPVGVFPLCIPRECTGATLVCTVQPRASVYICIGVPVEYCTGQNAVPVKFCACSLFLCKLFALFHFLKKLSVSAVGMTYIVKHFLTLVHAID